MVDSRPMLAVDADAAITLLSGGRNAVHETLHGWHEAGLWAKLVRGRKMLTVDAMFDEFAAALQFPHYFGENWAAFDECLSERDWFSSEAGMVIAMSDPADFLTGESASELRIFARIMKDAATTYASPIELGEWWDRPAIPFHLVLLAGPIDSANTTSLRGRWEASGAQISIYPSS